MIHFAMMIYIEFIYFMYVQIVASIYEDGSVLLCCVCVCVCVDGWGV